MIAPVSDTTGRERPRASDRATSARVPPPARGRASGSSERQRNQEAFGFSLVLSDAQNVKKEPRKRIRTAPVPSLVDSTLSTDKGKNPEIPSPHHS